MAIEVYSSGADAQGDRPPDVLARRLLGAGALRGTIYSNVVTGGGRGAAGGCLGGGALRVTIYSNVVTVEAPEAAWAVLEPKVVRAIEHLFEFYGDEAGGGVRARGS